MQEYVRRYGLVAVLLVLGWWAYAPGLNSLLLYDDFPNLSALAVIAPEPVFSESFWQFVLGGGAGPTGRPLALLSFALQAESWPDAPYAFKAVNLAIHALNALLLMLVAREVAKLLRLDGRAGGFFVLATGTLWFLHPMHAGTVLFAVQRMTLLASSFLLAGVWCHLRIRLHPQPPSKQALWLTVSLGAWGLLALLSKELAPVLVCYLLALEYTVLADTPTSTVLRRWRLCCLWLPLLALPVLAALYWPELQASYAQFRGFNASERLLTEARVLWIYLQTLVAPSSANVALFQLPTLSTSLWQPLSTLPAVLAWISATALAVVLRRRMAWLSLAVFWYLGGHVIESTVLPLELQFNHRSYLAVAAPLMAAVYALTLLPARLPKFRYGSEMVAAVFGLFFLVQTAQQARLWSEPLQLASTWYAANPENPTNAEFLAVQLAAPQWQQADQAANLYDQLVRANPGIHRFLFNRWLLGCRYPQQPAIEPALVELARRAPIVPGNDLSGPLSELASLAANDACPTLDTALLVEFAEANYRASSGQNRGLLAYQLGRLLWIRGEAGSTRSVSDWFAEAYALTEDPGILFTHAQYQLGSGRPLEALALLDTAERRVSEHNDIATGKREQKLAALASFRDAANRSINDPAAQ